MMRPPRAAIALGGVGLACLPALLTLHLHLQAAALLLGLLLIAAGLGATPRLAPRPTDRLPLRLAALTLLGFALRLWAVDDALHSFIDELHFVEGLVRLRDDANAPLLAPMNAIAAFPHIYAYGQLAAVDALGPTLLALRLPSVLLGTLTIPAAYRLGAVLLGRRAGLLAALVLGTLPAHLHFSRLALNNIADPLFGTLALALALSAWRAQGAATARRLAGAAGIMLGLSAYFYEGGRLIYPALALVVLAWGRRPRLAARLALAYALTVAPLALYLLTHALPAWPRLEASSGGPFRPLDAALHLLLRPESRPFYYGGSQGLTPPWLLPFLLIGLAWLLRRGKIAVPALLLLVVLGNGFIAQPDWSARYVVALPALAVGIAAGLAWLILHTPRRMRACLLGAVTLTLAAGPLVYFGPHLAQVNDQVRPGADAYDALFRARDLELPLDAAVLILTPDPVFLPHVALLRRFWSLPDSITVAHPRAYTLRAPNRLPPGAPLAVFIAPTTPDARAHLARAVRPLPTAQFSPYRVPDDREMALYLLRLE